MNLSVYSRSSYRTLKTRSDLLSIGALSVAVKPVLEQGTRLLDSKIKVIPEDFKYKNKFKQS